MNNEQNGIENDFRKEMVLIIKISIKIGQVCHASLLFVIVFQNQRDMNILSYI